MMTNRVHQTRLGALVLGLAVLALSACVDLRGDDEAMQNLKEVLRDDAMRMADDHANRVVSMIGGGVKLENPKTGTVPCEGPGSRTEETVYYAAGHYQIAPIPEDQQLSTLRRLREQWQQQGYTITQDRVFPDGKTGELVVRNSVDEFEIAVITTEPPTAFALSISSPCYRSHEPWPRPPIDSPT